MRRLVGLIVLLALILGGVWLARNDFNLNQIAAIDRLFKTGEGDAAKERSEAVGTEAPPEAAAAAPEARGPEKDAAAASQQTELPATAAEPAGSVAAAAPPPAEAAGQPESSESVSVPQAETPAVSEAPSADTEVATNDTARSSEAAAPEAGTVIPSFDIVRVEPTGDTVLAGIAEPRATVEVLSGPEPVATAEANERGEWAMVLDAPLPPGTHDLAIRTTSQDRSRVTLSDQRVAVSVPETPDEEPLVVLDEPNAPSRVLQLPAEAKSETETAAAPGVPAAANKATAETEVAVAPPPQAVAEPSAPGKTEIMASSPSAAAPAAPTKAPGETEIAAASPPEAAAKPSAPGKTEIMASPPSTEAPAAPDKAPAETEVAAAPAQDLSEEPSPPAEPALAAPKPSSLSKITVADAPEAAPMAAPSTSSDNVVAGAPPMSPSLAEAPSSPEPPSTKHAQPASGSPQPPVPSSAAETANAAPAGEAALAPPDVVGSEPPQAPPPAVTPKVSVGAVEAETNGGFFVAGTAATKDPVRVYVDDAFVGEATPTESGSWLLEAKREMAPDTYMIRADQVDPGSGAVIARAEVPFEREIDVATLKPTGQAVDASTAELSGKVTEPTTVIIKRGDNLWTISRKVYGRGIRYSTIYQANRDQIRDPDRIYPGQVFILPAGDANWQN